MTVDEFRKAQREKEAKENPPEPKIKVRILKGSVNDCKANDIIDIQPSLIAALTKNNPLLKYEEVIEAEAAVAEDKKKK